jgi:hypothetical protein
LYIIYCWAMLARHCLPVTPIRRRAEAGKNHLRGA